MTLVLVTGAGASRNLGTDAPMPLMPDWSDALCEALDTREANLAAACHLSQGMDGPTFESNLGLVLRWQQVRHLEERFGGLGGPQAGSTFAPQQEARANTTRRLAMVSEALNATLYDQFGQRRVEDEKARAAYEALLRELGDPGELVIATTNYDRSVEAALHALGHSVTTGFVVRPGRTPILQAAGFVDAAKADIPVIHLHGAVGWYDKDGNVEDHYADQPYNPSLGSPVVLYPDPEKDPTGDATVNQLWREFEDALDRADRIFVLGHSLHDPALVRDLRRSQASIAVSFFDEADRDRIAEQLPKARAIQVDFGPEPSFDESAIRGWLGPRSG